MGSFRIQFEWEDPAGVRGAELAATWARLEILVAGRRATEIQDLRTNVIREGIYVPLYPIAEWAVTNWWRLWFEDRAHQEQCSSFERHSVLAAREGFALPDVRLWPTESAVIIEASPYQYEPASVRFLNSAHHVSEKEEVRAELVNLIEAVLAKLSDAQIAGTPLQEEWQMIMSSESDDSERDFCEHAARLGLDPYAMDAAIAKEIEGALRSLPSSVRQDFFDSADSRRLTEEVDFLTAFLRSAARRNHGNPWKQLPTGPTRSFAGLLPWEQGYRFARFLRDELGIRKERFSDERDILSGLEIDSRNVWIDTWRTEQMDAVMALSKENAPVFAIAGTRPESRNFAFCRAFGEFLQLTEPQPLVLTRRSDSHRQKRSRAFAAEFLAPAAMIREQLKSSVATDSDCEELGNVFGVSSWVIQRQIVNHHLASYIGPAF